jgi:hypothetical protein
MIKEHEQVVLTTDLPEYSLKSGDVGVVVHIYTDGQAYEIELFTLERNTLDVVTVEASQVRPVSRFDVLHVRERTA